MQAVYKYIPGKRSGKTTRIQNKFASFTVNFVYKDAIGNVEFSKNRDIAIQLDGSPQLIASGLRHYKLTGEVDNLNPAAIQLIISQLGDYQALTPSESTLFMRMKPFLPKLFEELAKSFPNSIGCWPKVEFVFQDETFYEMEELEPAQIFFACCTPATHGVGTALGFTIRYDQTHPGAYDSKTKTWYVNDLADLTVPTEITKNISPEILEIAFRDLAQNMFAQVPVPDDVKIWNFKAVTKTVTEITRI